MRENIEAIRRSCSPWNEVSYEGEFVTLDRVRLDVAYGDTSPRDIPIYIGATGPKMLELSGGDLRRPGAELRGVHRLHPRRRRHAWRDRRRARGQDDSTTSTARSCWRARSPTTTPSEAVLTGKSLVAYYLGTEPHIMEASGADPDLVERVQEIVGWPATEEDYRKAAHLIPDDLCRSLMAVGTAAECRDKVAEYIDAGVTCPILYPTHADIEPVVDAFAGLGTSRESLLIGRRRGHRRRRTFTIHDPGWVHVVDDGGSSTVGAMGRAPPDRPRTRRPPVIDATGCAVMPGMTNAHTHLFQTFFRGLADDKPLLDWLRDCIWPGAVHLDRDSAGLRSHGGPDREPARRRDLGHRSSVRPHRRVHRRRRVSGRRRPRRPVPAGPRLGRPQLRTPV